MADGADVPLYPRRVWKFTLLGPDADSRSYANMPREAQPLSVGIQDGELVVWALVASPPGDDYTLREFIVTNTGPTFPYREARFLGTVIASTGIVWHIWDGG